MTFPAPIFDSRGGRQRDMQAYLNGSLPVEIKAAADTGADVCVLCDLIGFLPQGRREKERDWRL